MIYTIHQLGRARWWLLVVLIALAPFHAFLATWLKIPGFSIWREILVLLIMVLIVVEFLLVEHSTRPKLRTCDWFILALIIPSFFWFFMALLSEKDWAISQWALGFRYDVLPWIFLFFLRRVEWAFPEKLVKIFFGGAAVVLIFGLAQALVLPKDFLTHFGYSNYQGEFTTALGVPACQFLEHTGRFCRAVSTFGGPTRYGTYLLLVIGLLSLRAKRSNLESNSKLDCFGLGKLGLAMTPWSFALAALALLNILLTFSRSVWIGLFAMSVFAFLWYVPRRTKLKSAVAAAILGVAVLAGSVWYSSWKGERSWTAPILKTIFVRESSTSAHAELLKKGLRVAAEKPLGIGLGTVGPSSVRYGEKFLTENWYLQIAIEMGWLGLLIFLGMLAALSRELLKTGRTGLFLALLGISVAGLFTHAFEETTTMLLFTAFSALDKKQTRL